MAQEALNGLTCSHCDATVARPAREQDGSIVVHNRYVRVTAKGVIYLGCPRCGRELDTPMKLTLRVKRP